ncbi:TetR/AcrR family transcriptional regulator [Lysinibacillus sp. FSL K6-3209]|uniref:TetR/AcrR family transcriptional regulator n=1 Tax=Lysinibacillus sp. FSL K6-3209 TaxID=2921497 RepID=UPI0030D8AF02
MGRDRKFSTLDLFLESKKLVLAVGYEGFTIARLAESLEVSRAAIYKYYTNKDELLMDFMLHEMDKSVKDLLSIPAELSYLDQLDELLHSIFRSKDLHLLLGIAEIIPTTNKPHMQEKKEKLSAMHFNMYGPLMRIVQQGKKEGFVDDDIPNDLVLGFIFQSINIPNHSQMDEVQFFNFTKLLILNGVRGKNK